MFENIPSYSWKSTVPTVADLPTLGNQVGDARVTESTASIYVWNGSAWIQAGGGGGGTVTSVTASSPLASSGGSTPNITLTSPLPVANGGTNSLASLSNSKVIVSISGAIVESTTTTTQLSFLDATSSIQTQLNSKAPTDSPTFTTKILFGNYHVEPSQVSLSAISSMTIDLATASGFSVNLITNTSVSLINPQIGAAYAIEIVQAGGGSHTVSWPATVKWPGGVAPIITVTNGAIDLIHLYYDGTRHIGSFLQNVQ